MENVVRTVYGSALQTTQFCNLPFSLQQNTTLNEKFGVQSGVVPSSTPTVKYYCIGNGGHSFSSGTNNIALVQSLEHLATDAALFSHLPFVLRATNNDLDATTAAKYALRTVITVGTTPYIAYYLKRLDFSAATVQTQVQTQTSTGSGASLSVTSSNSTFTPSAANLSPTAVQLTTNGVNALAGTYALVSATVGMQLTAAECQEILNAATILYGSPQYAVISEIGLCSGVDKSVPLSTGSGVFFNEAVAVQVCSFVSTFHSVYASQTGISGTLQLGSAEPMITVSS